MAAYSGGDVFEWILAVAKTGKAAGPSLGIYPVQLACDPFWQLGKVKRSFGVKIAEVAE